MHYGIPDNLWKQLPPEDQNEIINAYYGKQVVPSIGGYAPPPAQAPPPEPQRTTASTKAGDIVWAYVRSLNSFPGNHPYFDQDRAVGIGGYMLEAHDPYLVQGANACRAAGFLVGVWSDPHGEDPTTYAQNLVNAAHSVDAVAVAPDPESTGKGYDGSPGWKWNAEAARAIRALDPSITIIVTPTPNQDDFNYAAWLASGALVWVQLYGEKLTDLFNADEVINRLKANGVPANRIGALIPAGAIGIYIPELQKLGVEHWAIYTIDDVSAGDRSVPFGGTESPTTPAEPVPAGDGSPSSSDSDLSVIVARAIGAADVVDIPDADEGAVDEGDVPDISWIIDDAFRADDDTAGSGTDLRFLSVSSSVSGTFPSWCLRSVGGYVQGVSGPINPGLRQIELLIGVEHVHGDYATHGHAPRSKHYCGLAADVDNSRWIWDYLFPIKQELLQLLGPWGLYDRGVRYYDADEQAAHKNHIHIGCNKTADAISTLLPRLPSGKLHVPGGSHQAPTVVAAKPINLDTVSGKWHALMQNLDTNRRAVAKRVRRNGDQLMGIVK